MFAQFMGLKTIPPQGLQHLIQENGATLAPAIFLCSVALRQALCTMRFTD